MYCCYVDIGSVQYLSRFGVANHLHVSKKLVFFGSWDMFVSLLNFATFKLWLIQHHLSHSTIKLA